MPLDSTSGIGQTTSTDRHRVAKRVATSKKVAALSARRERSTKVISRTRGRVNFRCHRDHEFGLLVRGPVRLRSLTVKNRLRPDHAQRYDSQDLRRGQSEIQSTSRASRSRGSRHLSAHGTGERWVAFLSVCRGKNGLQLLMAVPSVFPLDGGGLYVRAWRFRLVT